MKSSFFLLKAIAVVAFAFLFAPVNGYGQILHYTTDSSGALFSVATNATGTPLARVNSAAHPGTPCTNGFTTRNFTTASTYSSALPAVEVTATPNSGYSLNVTGFNVGLRRSSTGPASARLAYSTDGGVTWVDQGTDQTPNNNSCDSVVTCTWTTTFVVTAPNLLKFRVYGFNASSTTGNLQIMNLLIDGTVSTVAGCSTTSGLSASMIGSGCANLHWLPVTGAVSYVIQYRPTGTTTWTSATSAVDSVSVSGLTPGTTYEFQVQTLCSVGTSVFSASSTFTTLPCATPTGVTSSAVTTTSALISWSAVTGAIGYNVGYRLSGSTGWTVVTTPSTSTTITGLASGSTYQYEVQAICTCGGTSAYSAISSFTTLVPCGTPTGLTESAISSSCAELHWTAVSGATSYNIQYRPTGTTTWLTTSSTVDSVAVSGLSYATTYEFQVQAVCASGTSSFSASATFVTLSCLIPSGITATSITTTSALISWTAVSGAVSYNLGYRVSGTTTWTTIPVSGTSTTLTGLTPGTTYQYDVQSVCTCGGTSSYSTVSTFTTLTVSSCGTPTGLTATSITSSSALLSWTPVVGATSYNIQYRPTSGLTWTTVTSAIASYPLTGLAPSTTYQFRVQAVCASGTSAYSTVASFTTLACLVPSGLTSSAITTTSATVSWTAVTGAASYTVGYRVSGTTTWTTVTVTGTSATLTGLTAGTTYQFEVRTTCTGGGTSPWSAIGTFTTLTTTGCGMASGLTASAITSSSALLSWSAVTGATSYNIRYRPTSTTTTLPWVTVTSATTSVSVTGLSYATTYEYQVQAVCASGAGSFTASSMFTTLTCLIPTGITVSGITTSSATISWTAVTGAVSYTVGYRLAGTSTWTNVVATGTSLTLTGLMSDSTYQYDVQTTCTGGGTSSWSSTAAFTTLLSATCGTPAGLTTSGITTTSAILSWTPVSGATSYSVQYRPTGTTTWTTTTTATPPLTITGLTPSTSYEFQVKSICATGTSAYSPSGLFATLGTCTVPTGLAASSITSTSATLSWSVVPGATSYVVNYRVSGTTTWTPTTTTTASVTISPLSPGTTYEFQVQALCAGGPSGFSASTLFSTTPVTSGNYFTYYFTQPVDTSVRTGRPAVWLNNCMADTLVAYINRAKYTIDIAQYEYIQGAYANIATAINNAVTARGVKVRWIYDGAATNTGLASLLPSINTLASPTTSAYGIMHNKFMIIDAKSTTATDPLVWTGSIDWTSEQFRYDFNNALIIQDAALARAYLNQFNMMWGDTGIAPNPALSKFGPFKSNLPPHIFTIGGKTVELYFSPKDSTNFHIQATINTANTDLYFGMYTFTDNSDATMIVAKHTAGVYVAGIDDQFSNPYTPYTTFTSGLGSMFKVYSPSGAVSSVYHNKYLIVDPSNTCSDPMVLTGSHNWTSAADMLNDENTLIIHDATAANIYYQAFHKDFAGLGGALTHVAAPAGCNTVYLRLRDVTGVATAAGENDNISIFPNPSNDQFTIACHIGTTEKVTITISDYLGRSMTVPVNDQSLEQGDHQFIFAPQTPGVYVVKMTTGDHVYTGKMIKL